MKRIPSSQARLCAGVICLLGLAACGGGGGGSSSTPTQTAPAITTQPTSQTVTAPTTATFTVVATGNPTPTYQWDLAGAAIPGATSATYTTPATTTAMSGGSYTCVVTNSAGSVTSAAVTLTVKPAGSVKVALNVPTDTTVGGFNYTQGSYLEGFEFTANSAITITQLGAYDSNLSALPYGAETFATVPVALYDMTTNTLLGTVNVSASDPATGVYRYHALASPVTLNTTDTYSVAWVSLTNNYIASPTLVASDVNAAINYLAMDGNGPGGLTMTEVMLEPNWFFTIASNGLAALNYDLGPNFMFQ